MLSFPSVSVNLLIPRIWFQGFGLTVVRFAEDGNLQTLDRAMYEELQRMALEESAAEDTPNPHQ